MSDIFGSLPKLRQGYAWTLERGHTVTTVDGTEVEHPNYKLQLVEINPAKVIRHGRIDIELYGESAVLGLARNFLESFPIAAQK